MTKDHRWERIYRCKECGFIVRSVDDLKHAPACKIQVVVAKLQTAERAAKS